MKTLSLTAYRKQVNAAKKAVATKFEQDIPLIVGDVEFIVIRNGKVNLGYTYRGKNMFWGDGLKLNFLQVKSLVNRGFYKEVRKNEYYERVDSWEQVLRQEQQAIQYRAFQKVVNG
jgi:hypothetical protein